MALGPRTLTSRPVTTQEPTTDMILSKVLASIVYLRLTSHMAHFNVTGPSFYSDHKTYESVYEMFNEWIDNLGERITAIGHPVDIHPECLADCVVFGSGHEDPVQDAGRLCMSLLSKMDALSAYVMGVLDKVDEVSANMLQDFCHNLDKQRYFVRRGFQAA